MSEILFLSHRIPYPPDKGDKIRSYHLLRALAEQHTVHLGTFIDDEADWSHVDALKRLCGEVCIRPLKPLLSKLRSARGLLVGQPLTLSCYRDAELRNWLRDLALRRPLAGMFCFSSSMGQYANGVTLQAGAPRVMDFCDVDSDKWRQYSAAHSLPLKYVFDREARTLALAEARYVRDFDASIVISDVEASLLRGVANAGPERILVVPNGVDADYFDPTASYATPFEGGERPVVFTGAMDYRANIDAVEWFASEVFPRVRQGIPQARFVIVGSNPTRRVLALAETPGVVVTGRVPDVRPYLAYAGAVVAPLRLARGVQNKVLEAMSMARPVIATENAVQGIPGAHEGGVTITSDAGAMAEVVVRELQEGRSESRGRAFVRQRYDWKSNVSRVMALFGRVDTGRARPGVTRSAVA